MSIQEIVDRTMPSLTEWLEKINPAESDAFRLEDNSKRDRLEVLYQTIGLIYDRPDRVLATDIVNNTPVFQEIVNVKGNDHCALRLIPLSPELPKLRVRGKTLNENLIWFFEQAIDPQKYKVEIIPHPDETPFAGIFVINDRGAWGEIVPGWHWQLTQGIQDHDIATFAWNFSDWSLSIAHDEMLAVARETVNRLQILDPEIRQKLSTELNAEFTANNYLKGYFEFVVLPNKQIQFIDYNRILGKLFHDATAEKSKNETNKTDLTGLCASPGLTRGRVRIVFDPTTAEFNEGDILVCPMTMVDYVPLMKKATAIVTEQGNILSHAAIISRELRKPCLVGVKNATKILKNGDEIEVDAVNGRLLQLSQVTSSPMTEEVFIRPTWDEYFMEIARAVAKRATCDRGRSGCVISRDKQILVTGYVGSAAGLPHCDEVGHQMKTVTHEDGHQSQHCVRTAHAEQNAIVQAARLGIGINGSTLYCKMTPCAACGRMIINSGIKRVVCEKRYHAGSESEEMFRRVGLQLDYFDEQVEQYANQ